MRTSAGRAPRGDSCHRRSTSSARGHTAVAMRDRAPMPWIKQLRADQQVLARGIATRGSRAKVMAAAARLADSRHAGELDAAIAAIGDAAPTVDLALAKG